KRFSGYSADAEALLRNYDWPGNVRQVENIVRSIVVLYDAEVVTADMIPAPVNRGGMAVIGNGRRAGDSFADSSAGASDSPGSIRSLRDIEKESIENAIAACDGNVSKAAALLGVSPSTLYRKRQAWHDE
ncbi:MAG: helix-turn-helix domain-containing protein, partial [Gammaproteobacteria bacterium]